MNIFKTMWNWVKGCAKTLICKISDSIFKNVKSILSDQELIDLAFAAIKEAFQSGLKDKKAFNAAKKKFEESLKAAGKDIKTSTINLILETVYNGWKELGYPEE